MAGQYDDQRALKTDYSLFKRETYIQTIRCLIERGKRFANGPLGVICYSKPEFSDGSLPS